MTIARVSVEGKRIRYRDKQVLPGTALLGANGTAVSPYGREIFRLDGTHDTLPAPWSFSSNISPAGRYAIFVDFDHKPERVRVVDVLTGRGWDTHVRGVLDVWLTSDGQAFIADIRFSSFKEDTRIRLIERIPGIEQFLDREYLVLYRKNSRSVAQLDLKDYLKHRPDWYYPSPDGHSVAVIGDVAVNGYLKPVCLLYRY